MVEEIEIRIGGGKDKISSIEEGEDVVIVSYASRGQTRPIVVPMHIIKFVKEVLDSFPVGEPSTSKVVYHRYIRHYKLKSKIIEERAPILKKVLGGHNLVPMAISNILHELDENDNFSLMTFKEMIGSRDVKTSDYFKIYAAIRYWVAKELISYNSKGTICRLI